MPPMRLTSYLLGSLNFVGYFSIAVCYFFKPTFEKLEDRYSIG